MTSQISFIISQLESRDITSIKDSKSTIEFNLMLDTVLISRSTRRYKFSGTWYAYSS